MKMAFQQDYKMSFMTMTLEKQAVDTQSNANNRGSLSHFVTIKYNLHKVRYYEI